MAGEYEDVPNTQIGADGKRYATGQALAQFVPGFHSDADGSYTVDNWDDIQLVVVNGDGSNAVILPAPSTEDIGKCISVVNIGSGIINVQAASGTLSTVNSEVALSVNGKIEAHVVSASEIVASGDLEAGD